MSHPTTVSDSLPFDYTLEISARLIRTPRPRKSADIPLPTSAGESKSQPTATKPQVPMAGPGRLMTSVAAELGGHVMRHGFYNLRGQPAYLDTNSNTFEILKPERMRVVIEQFIDPVRLSATGNHQLHSISSAQAKTIMHSDSFLRTLPEVERFNTLRLPVLRADGTVSILPVGYDRETKILTAAGGPQYSERLHLSGAKTFLTRFFKDFQFSKRPVGEAAALAAMLTTFGVHLFRDETIVPAFLYNANRPGAGKGLLANAAIIPVTGHPITGVKSSSEEEMRKTLLPAAMESQPIVFFDNVKGLIDSGSLESFITSSTITGRVLGASRTEIATKATVVLITGNGCTLGPDMVRRTIIVDLTLPLGDDTRKITDYLDERRIQELRPDILGALYALIREWAKQGKPIPSRPHLSFARWSQVIGGIIESAGYALPY